MCYTMSMSEKRYTVDGEAVKVTGKSGDYYRVYYYKRGNMSHDWVHKSLVKSV